MPSKTADLYIRFVLWGLAGNCLVLLGSIFIKGEQAAHFTRVLVLAATVFLSIFLVVLSFQAENHSPSLDAEGKYRGAEARSGRGNSFLGNGIAAFAAIVTKYLLGFLQSLSLLPKKRAGFQNKQARTQAGFFGEIASSAEEKTQNRRPFSQTPNPGRSQFGSVPEAASQAPSAEQQAVFNPQQQARRVDTDSRAR